MFDDELIIIKICPRSKNISEDQKKLTSINQNKDLGIFFNSSLYINTYCTHIQRKASSMKLGFINQRFKNFKNPIVLVSFSILRICTFNT